MSSYGTLAESIVAMAILAAMLLALADTPLYPVALGAVAIALLYIFLHNEQSTNALTGLTGWLQRQLGPQTPTKG